MMGYGIGSKNYQSSLSEDSAGLSPAVFGRRVFYSALDPQIPTLRELRSDASGVYSIYGFFASPRTP